MDTLRMKMERELAEAEARFNGLLAKNSGASEAQERQISLLEAQIKALKAELAQAVEVEKELRRTMEDQSRSLTEATNTVNQLHQRMATLEGQYKELGLLSGLLVV